MVSVCVMVTWQVTGNNSNDNPKYSSMLLPTSKVLRGELPTDKAKRTRNSVRKSRIVAHGFPKQPTHL